MNTQSSSLQKVMSRDERDRAALILEIGSLQEHSDPSPSLDRSLLRSFLLYFLDYIFFTARLIPGVVDGCPISHSLPQVPWHRTARCGAEELLGVWAIGTEQGHLIFLVSSCQIFVSEGSPGMLAI